MAWTATAPTSPGFYWLHNTVTGKTRVVYVRYRSAGWCEIDSYCGPEGGTFNTMGFRRDQTHHSMQALTTSDPLSAGVVTEAGVTIDAGCYLWGPCLAQPPIRMRAVLNAWPMSRENDITHIGTARCDECDTTDNFHTIGALREHMDAHDKDSNG